MTDVTINLLWLRPGRVGGSERYAVQLLKSLCQVQDRLVERGVEIVVTTGAEEWLASTGYDPLLGARPLRRAIQRFVENPLSNRILGGEFGPGSHVEIDVAGDGATLTFDIPAKTEVTI